MLRLRDYYRRVMAVMHNNNAISLTRGRQVRRQWSKKKRENEPV